VCQVSCLPMFQDLLRTQTSDLDPPAQHAPWMCFRAARASPTLSVSTPKAAEGTQHLQGQGGMPVSQVQQHFHQQQQQHCYAPPLPLYAQHASDVSFMVQPEIEILALHRSISSAYTCTASCPRQDTTVHASNTGAGGIWSHDAGLRGAAGQDEQLQSQQHDTSSHTVVQASPAGADPVVPAHLKPR